MIKKLTILFICFLISGIAYANETYEQKPQVWDNPEEDAIADDMLGFIAVDTLENIPADWPEYVVKRFVKLDEKAQKLIMDRERTGEAEKLKNMPYSTIHRSTVDEWEIENLWMSKPDLHDMEWDKDPIVFDRKRGSRYLYVNVPDYRFWTKMFVYGENAEIVQDFEGNGAITKFDETEQLRVDVFDAEGYIGTAYNRPVAKWVKKILGENVDPDYIWFSGMSILQDLGDNYLIYFVSGVTSGEWYHGTAYMQADGEFVWANIYDQAWLHNGNTMVIDGNHYVVATYSEGYDADETGKVVKYRISDGSIEWELDRDEGPPWDAYLRINPKSVAVLPDGTYAVSEKDNWWQEFQVSRITSSGSVTNWGNSGASITLTYPAGAGKFTKAPPIVVDNDGYLWVGEPLAVRKYQGNAGATQGNLLASYEHYTPVTDPDLTYCVDICAGHNGDVVALYYVNTGTDYFTVYAYAPSGNTSFTKTFTATAPVYTIESISPCDDGGYVLGGYHATGTDYISDIYKLDANGNLDFSQSFDGTGQDVIQTNDGGYLSVGNSNDSVTFGYFVKTNQYGETCSKGEPCQ